MIRTNDDTKGTKTILVVEDEKEIRGLAVEFLESLVYEVLEAGDGPSALDVLEKKGKDIDLVFSDVNPGFPRWLPPVADDGSTKGVRTTLPVVNRRGRSGSAPYQADLAIENPTH